jgi:hypothetical protein
MKTLECRNGIIVLKKATLEAHSGKVSGGFGNAELAGYAVTFIGSAITVYLNYTHTRNALAAFATIASDCLGFYTKGTALQVIKRMRDGYPAASGKYDYYNFIYFEVENDNMNWYDAFLAAEEKGTWPRGTG